MGENESCFYIPALLFEKEYAAYSTEAKLLVGVMLSVTEKPQSMIEAGEIVGILGKKTLSAMHMDLQRQKQEGNNV